VSIAIRGGSPVLSAVTGTTAPSVTLSGASQPQAGDVLIIIHANDFYLLSNMPTPTVGGSSTGVTAITNGTADGGSNLGHVKSYFYVVPSTGNLTVTVAETGTHDEEKDLIVYPLSGADTVTVIDTAGNATYGTTSSHALPNISPATSNAYLIAHDNSGGGVNVTSYTPPSGMTEVYDSPNSATMGNTGAVKQLSAAGAIGALSFTPAGSANGVVIAIAVLTATAAAPLDSTAVFYMFTPGMIAPSGLWTPGPYIYDTGGAPAVNAVTDPEADATAVGYDAQAAITVSTTDADATASAADAQAAGGPSATEADATTAGFDATAAVAANAGQAAVTATAFDTAVSTAPNAGEADATATGYDAQAAAGVNAGEADATATAYDITVQTNTNPSAGEADATATAYDAMAAAGPNAGVAAATATAYDAAATVAATAGEADAAATGYSPNASVGVNAGEADATATAYDATVQTSSNPSAGEAAATATAYDATVSTSGVTNAPAGEADATATAYDATVSVTVNAESASATVTGLDAQAATGVNAGTATVSATGWDASVSVAPAAGAGVVTADAADASVAINVAAASASAGAVAYDATVSAPVNALAGLATAAAAAFDATVIASGGVHPFTIVDSSGSAAGAVDPAAVGLTEYDMGGTGQGFDEGGPTGSGSTADSGRTVASGSVG
jgi:hypothetical protein